MDLDFNIVRNAGIANSELATILRVSKTTVGKWASGSSKPQHFVLPQVRKLLKLLSIGMERGEFPIPYGPPSKHNRQDRIYAIASALKRVAAESSAQEANS